jgi:hypothetical protein
MDLIPEMQGRVLGRGSGGALGCLSMLMGVEVCRGFCVKKQVDELGHVSKFTDLIDKEFFLKRKGKEKGHVIRNCRFRSWFLGHF